MQVIMWRPEDNFWESVFPVIVGSVDYTQVARYFYTLNYLASPNLLFLKKD